jgi:hypothetical protein
VFDSYAKDEEQGQTRAGRARKEKERKGRRMPILRNTHAINVRRLESFPPPSSPPSLNSSENGYHILTLRPLPTIGHFSQHTNPIPGETSRAQADISIVEIVLLFPLPVALLTSRILQDIHIRHLGEVIELISLPLPLWLALVRLCNHAKSAECTFAPCRNGVDFKTKGFVG